MMQAPCGGGIKGRKPMFSLSAPLPPLNDAPRKYDRSNVTYLGVTDDDDPAGVHREEHDGVENSDRSDQQRS